MNSRKELYGGLAVTWLIIAMLVLSHARAMRDYVELADSIASRGVSNTAPPIIYFTDAKTWIRHAQSLLVSNSIQLRHTFMDNAPMGRDVYWNSAWAWVIAGSGYVWQWFHDVPIVNAIEHAAMWLNSVVFLAIVFLFSFVTAKRAGIIGGVIVAFGMVGSDKFYEGFFPTYVDHHGLLTSSVLGMTLGVLFMGGGWITLREHGSFITILPESESLAKRAAVISAICGSVGMWISAASVFPPIVILGLSGLVTTLVKGRDLRRSCVIFSPECWRIWGRTGAALSVIFYMMEFAPSHFGMRLEANHPLYALAWLGGGEFVAEVSEIWLAENGKQWVSLRMIVSLLAILAAPVTMILGGERVFILQDHFMVGIHQNTDELYSPWENFKLSEWSWRGFFAIVEPQFILLILAIVQLIRFKKSENVVLWISFIAASCFTLMGWWQSRWLMNASAPMICLSLVVLATLSRGRSRLYSWILTILSIVMVYLPPAVIRVTDVSTLVDNHKISRDYALQVLYRDIAAAVINSTPDKSVVLLSNPDCSSAISYYGRFQSIGTLYWENVDGLKASAAILAAHGDDEAARILSARGVTHIAIISEDNIIPLYYELLHPNAPGSDVRQCFGYRLATRQSIPPWLKIIPYEVPGDLQSLAVTVLLYKVAIHNP